GCGSGRVSRRYRPRFPPRYRGRCRPRYRGRCRPRCRPRRRPRFAPRCAWRWGVCLRVAVGARWIGHTAADMPSLVVAEDAGLRAEKPEITVLVVSGGVVLPVVQEQPVIDPINEPGRDKGVDELIGVAIPA